MKGLRALLLGLLLAGSIPVSRAASLDEQLEALRKAGESASETAVHRVLVQGIKESRSAEVDVVVREWLQVTQVKNPEVLYLAGVSSEMAASFDDAITYYRKVLTVGSPRPELAARAVPALYRAMILGKGDPDGAYLFMRQQGSRLRPYGTARKFDPWFLDQATKRNDVVALVERLAIIFNEEGTDLSVFKPYLDACQRGLESFEHDGALSASIRKLAAAKAIGPRQKARLLWIAEVVPLNEKINELFGAKKEVPAALFDGAVRAAANLMQVQPFKGSRLVGRGWCSFPDEKSGPVRDKAKLHRNLKSPALMRALSALPAEQVRQVLTTEGHNGVSIGVLLEPADLRKLIPLKPAAFNSLAGPDLPFYSKAMTTAEAGQLAPHLARNPSRYAAVVRAAARGNTAFTKAANDIAENEMWRFGGDYVTRGNLSRFLWDCGLEQDGEFREIDNMLRKAGTRPEVVTRALAKKAKPADVKAAQVALIKDLFSSAPQIPGALLLFDQLANAGGDNEKVVLLATLADADLSADREHLLHRALHHVRIGNRVSIPYGPGFVHGYHSGRFGAPARRAVMGKEPGKRLSVYLQKILTQQMASGELHGTLLGLWLRCTEPTEGKPFVEKLIASSAWSKVHPGYQALVERKEYYGDIVEADKDPADKALSRELLALPANPSAAQVTGALNAALQQARSATGFPKIEGLAKAARQPAACLPFARALLRDYAPVGLNNKYPGYLVFAEACVKQVQKTKDYKALQPVIPALWTVCSRVNNTKLPEDLKNMALASFEAGDYTTALGLARGGAKNLHHRGGKYFGWQVPWRERMQKLIGEVSEAIGATRIPVKEGDAGYQVFVSQKEFMLGNLDAAWALYDQHAEEVAPILQKLRKDYCFWLLDRNVEKGEAARVEELVKHLTVWDRRGDAELSMEQQAQLRLAYADVAFQKNSFGTARAWYRKISDNRSYRGSEQQYRALLGIVAVDREEKNYDDAVQILEKLLLVKDADLRARVYLARARIFFAQEKYAEADEDIAAVLRYDPQHANALLLQGEVQVAKRDLVSPSKIRLGMKRSAKAIEPGKMIEIDLKDPSLSVSGSGPIIEVEARAASGDVERMTLRAVGGKQAVYRAEVKTSLGAARPGDKVLQVLGRDSITYGFSKRFRAKMKDLPPDPKESVSIASDFHLAISAGDFPPREGEQQLSLEEMGLSLADQALGLAKIRPGNPFYVRVIDPDQSRTAGKDTVVVEVRASSGDVIRKFNLQETGPFTGEFEGAVPTASGQAVAYAYDSEPGRDPNMVISPRTDYPPWQGRITTETWNKFFTVDLNDLVDLKTMTLVSPGVGKLKAFLVQTSRNGKQWESLGCFPAEHTPLFDGRPQLRWVGWDTRSRAGTTLKSLGGWVAEMEKAMADPKTGMQNAYVKNINGEIPWFVHPKHGRGKVMHFRAHFYQKEVGTRRFEVTLQDGKVFPGVILVDGKAGSEENPSVIDREFNPGLHTLELWAVADQRTLASGKKQNTRLLCDGVDGEMVPCPDAMFDPATFPPAIREGIRGLAKVTEAQAGTFNIAFGKHSQAQFVRILIGDHAGDAPAIQRIALTDTASGRKLPVAADYQTLRVNQQLEVLPGDTVYVKYVDDLAYTEKRTQQEKRLSVAYNNARIAASFIQYQQQRDGSRDYKFEDIRRFRMDDNVGFIITDLDMDVSGKRDTVPFTVRTSDGNTKKFLAYETAAHSGEFLGKVFPVTGVPKRESEIRMAEGGTLTATYRDMENLDPGVPTYRSVMVEHARYKTPRFGIYTTTAEPIEFVPSLPEEDKDKKKRGSAPEVVVPRLQASSIFLDEDALKTQTPQALYNHAVSFNVIAPHLALAASSKIAAYVQTEAGRKAYAAMRKKAAAEGKALPPPVTPFDVNVPGTLKVSGGLGGGGGRLPAGYTTGMGRRRRSRGNSALDEGRFGFSVGLRRGEVPALSYANKAAEQILDKPKSLNIRPGDKVHIGYAFFDKAGNAQWRTATVTLTGHVLMDVMDEAYNAHLASRFVGEKVYVRVIAPALDVSPNPEEVTVQVSASSGAKTPFTLRETFGNSGIFKGNFRLGFATSPGAPVTPQEFFMRGLPVLYGDTVTVSWERALPQSFSFTINNGSDGAIESFSKRYTDSATAIKANFTLAECYFELAKMHRDMGKRDEKNGKKLVSLSRREMAHAKKLLEEALATHRDPDQQAHAEYLLGNLAQEYADTSENEDTKDSNYKDALARFSIIPVDYPDSLFAPKAQYKKALVYEKMKELEIAVEEYVKLGYKYPNDEHIPEAMSRIGGFFQERGILAKKKSDELFKKDDEESLKEAHEILEKAYRDFRWAANVFIRMQESYPKHPLAGLAGLRGGQNRMRYGDNEGAIEVFERVYLNPDYDGPDVRAQSMYWAGLAHEKMRPPPDSGREDTHKLHAIAHYEVIRYQFSASKWAKYARGRLASETLSQLSSSERKKGLPAALAALQEKMLKAQM